MAEDFPADVIGKLREAVVSLKNTEIYKQIVEPRDAVFARFQPIFSTSHIKEMTEDEFRSFLLFENNHHWSNLHRQGSRMCSDLGNLRAAINVLIDEAQPIADRLDKTINMVLGMGKNVASGILIVTHPDEYGVWNNRSESSMKRLGIWPAFLRGESFGKRYVKVNNTLLRLRDILGIDLWTLDAIWWHLEKMDEIEIPIDEDLETEPHTGATNKEQYFGLERHLHDFLRDNWNNLEIGTTWDIYKEPGDDEAGYEYPCDVGRIDLLAKHKTLPRWLVIELKRSQTSDQTIGQLLRYIGWVKKHLADVDEEVHGMIICREADNNLRYAIEAVKNVELQYYKVEFHLVNP